MEDLQSLNFVNWGLWTPLIGGILLYLGFNIYFVKTNDEEK